MTQQIIDALVAKYTAQKLESITNLNVYLQASVGVGEHPNIVAECDKLIDQIAVADGKIETLKALAQSSNEIAAANESSDNR
tara:strand:+ start:152 stop:397 length:246 start_codon:yes stop_codon:yes gene_type:complete